MWRRRTLTVIAAAALSASAVAPAPAAAGPVGLSAAPTSATAGGTVASALSSWPLPNKVVLAGAGIHTCPNNTCSVVTMTAPNDLVTDYCYRASQYLGGTIFWDLVTTANGTDVAGFINEHWLDSPSQTRDCSATDGVELVAATASRPGAGIHTCSRNTCPVVGFANGHQLTLVCEVWGQLLDGVAQWTLVYDQTAQVAGWTHVNWHTGFASRPC